MIQKTIEVQYSCYECKQENIKLVVPIRQLSDPIGPWMRSVAGRITADHKTKHPKCTAKKIGLVKIPLNQRQDSRIGESVH